MSSAILEMFNKTTNDGKLQAAAASDDLIPGGKYPFMVTSMKVNEQQETFGQGENTVKNPLFGHNVISLQVKLDSVGAKGYDELDGKSRTYFINKVTPDVVYGDKGRLTIASSLAADMIEVSGTKGQTFDKTLEWFLSGNKAMITIRQYKGNDGKQRNAEVEISRLA